MVTIRSSALIVLTGSEHERRTSPLIWTEHAPHCATPQPYLVPVSPTCSRITHKSGVSASTCTSRTLPFTLSFAMDSSLGVDHVRERRQIGGLTEHPQLRLHRVAGEQLLVPLRLILLVLLLVDVADEHRVH